MNKKILSLLKKIYFHENGFYNAKLDRHEHKIPESVSASDLDLLKSSGLQPNNFETFDHDSALNRLLQLKNNDKLTLGLVTSLFLKGITGEMPRGRQSLISYLYVKNLSTHSFEGKDSCEICGLPKKETEDKTDSLYRNYLGHVWNEIPLNYLIDLEEVLNLEKPQVSQGDKEKLEELLKFISHADDTETPGKLEKRIAAAKLLKNTDKYMRYGILMALAECGILPNDFIKPIYEGFSTRKEIWSASENLKTSSRSDIILPLGGWKGKNGVNFERYEEIFSQIK